MTTPPTPAGWYPDPDGSGGQRYWDGSAWTEHRSPGAQPTPEPAEPPTVVVPTRPAPPGERVGAHRKPEPEPEPSEPEPGPTAPVAQRIPPPAEPTFEPTFEPVPPPVAPGPPPSFESTYARPAPNDNRKLVVWYSAACAALLAVLVLVVIYAL